MRRWWFSAVLLAAYLGVFHLWHEQSLPRVRTVTLVAVLFLGGIFWWAWQQRYFVNRWDTLGHASVLADLALEGFLVKWHPDHSFYWCALAFALVLGGYRARQMTRRQDPAFA